jgi:cob(I)alamin adenosyltransferase
MQFARVGISSTELYSIKTELKEMFASSEEIKTFWMQQNSPPAVLEQTREREREIERAMCMLNVTT